MRLFFDDSDERVVGMLSTAQPSFRPAIALILLGRAAAGASCRSSCPQIDYIRVVKSARAMELYAGGQLAHTIERIQLGDAPEGHKRFQGDERTPEGRYTIDYGNPGSSYHLSLHISYPSAQDNAFARAQGRSPGGLIFIHGQPNDLPAGRSRATGPTAASQCRTKRSRPCGKRSATARRSISCRKVPPRNGEGDRRREAAGVEGPGGLRSLERLRLGR